ncbi:MAG: FtsX-like permease family protein, partial [Planctomycetaceae bacterium]
MSALRLIFRSLFFYWRQNLAMLAGVSAATAVIGGALVVGDSVRGSLRQMSLVRLGRVDHAVSTQRFFREVLADELEQNPDFRSVFSQAAPALSLMGSLERTEGETVHRVGRVQIYGVDERLWNLLEHGSLAAPGGREILFNRRVADQLQVSNSSGGSEPTSVTLTIELPADIPRDALLGERDSASREIDFTLRDVLSDELGAARFDLNPSQQLPLVAYVPLGTLQESLDLAKVNPSRRNPTGMPARVNSLFVASRSTDAAKDAAAEARALTDFLAKSISLEDVDLRIKEHAGRGYFSLESNRQILEDSLSRKAETTAEGLRLRTSPVLVYLANELANARQAAKFSMYSVVAGINPGDLNESPFGPFAAAAKFDLSTLKPDEILINDWLAADLDVKPGDEIALAYHVVGSHGELPEKSQTFRVAAILPLDDPAVADIGFTPEVKGITDAKTFRDWDQPFPMKLDRITKRDEDYWDKHKTTPKGFVLLSRAQELWGSRYGRLTSLRVAAMEGKSAAETARDFTAQFLGALTPEETGLAFRAVKAEGLRAATGSNDFSMLFIGFSFFLILSAAILVGLLFRLGIERRAANIGLLSAVGIPPRSVGRIILGEGLLVVIA